VFAPVAAHLAAGAELADAGEPIEASSLTTVDLPEPRKEGDALVAHALIVDRFGNAGLNVDHDRLAGTGITLGGTIELEVGAERYLAKYAQTFADVKPGELLVYEDSYRTLAVAINRGDAAATLGLQPDGEVRLRPR
jgi:S-adenosyl-L-methionine hydrolase (adenosine-forming)